MLANNLVLGQKMGGGGRKEAMLERRGLQKASGRKCRMEGGFHSQVIA